MRLLGKLGLILAIVATACLTGSRAFALTMNRACIDAFARSNPLIYRNRKLFRPLASEPKVFDESEFYALQTETQALMQAFEKARESLPADKRGGRITLTVPGRELRDETRIKWRESDFAKLTQVMLKIRGHFFIFEENFREDLATEATAKALRLLNAQGISVHVHFIPHPDEYFLELATTGDHPTNRMAASFQSQSLPLQFFYRPYKMITGNYSASLSQKRNLNVANETILSQTVHDVRMLHELRHWSNERGRLQKLDYAFAGRSRVSVGRLPGLRDVYSEFMSHDEPHAYIRTIKQFLIESIDNLKHGRRVSRVDVEANLQYGFRVSYRGEAIARILQRPTTKVIRFITDADGITSAEIDWNWGKSHIRTTIPLARSEADAPFFDDLVRLDKQLKWMQKAAAETRDRIDLAYQRFNQISGTPTIEDLKEMQSILIPGDYRTPPAD